MSASVYERWKRWYLKHKETLFWVLFFIVFVSPFLVIPRVEKPWLARLIYASMIMAFAVALFLNASLNPWHKNILDNAILASHGRRLRLVSELVCRLLLLAAVLSVLFSLAFPVWRATWKVCVEGRQPEVHDFTGGTDPGLLGCWFLWQELKPEDGGESYHLHFSWKIFKAKQRYRLLVAPGTRLVLQATLLDDARSPTSSTTPR